MAEAQKQQQKAVSDRLDTATDDLREVAQKLRLAARGVVTRLGENGTGFLDELVKAGEKLEKQREKERRKTARTNGGSKSGLEEARERLAGYLGLPTQEEVEKLNKKLNTLQRKVNKLEKGTGA